MFKITPVPENASLKKDPFQNRTFYEWVNPAKLDDLIYSKVLRQEWDDTKDPRKNHYKNEQEQLLAIQSNIATRVSTPGVQPVKYYRTEKGIGRVYPEKSLSIGSLRRKLRHTLASDYYYDIDIENAHPTFALHIFKNAGRSVPALERYVRARNDILAEIINNSSATRDDAKELFIRLLYGGTPSAWEHDTGIPLSTLPSPTQEFISTFHHEMTDIINLIASDNPELLTKYADRRNPKSTTASLFFQDLERRILETIFRSLCVAKLIPSVRTHRQQIYNAVLCFDGIMIPRENITREQLNEVFRRTTHTILTKYNIPIRLTIKEMNDGYTDDELKETADVEPEPLPFTFFSRQTMLNRIPNLADEISRMPSETDEQKEAIKKRKEDAYYASYRAMKEYFEDFFFLVDDPVGVCRLTPTGLEVMTLKSVAELCLALLIPYAKEAGKPPKFVDAWSTDINARRYVRADFYPPPMRCPRPFYNTFRPFVITHQSPTTAVIPPLYEKHLRLLTGGDDDPAYQYLLNYLAHLIQKPGDLPLVALLFKSDQGTGKNAFFENFGNYLLGTNYYKEVSAKDVFGTFATLRDQLMVVMDEFNGKDGYGNADALKALITGSKLAINEKYKPKYEINNCLRLILFSNNATPIKIEASDRRFVAFECSNKHANDRVGYFNYLIPALRDRTQMRQFYDFLLARDISGFHPAENRPLTNLYRELQSVNVPPVHLFITDFLEQYPSVSSTRVSAKSLYAKFCGFCDDNNISMSQGRCSISSKAFGREINRLPGVERQHTREGNGYELDFVVLRGFLNIPDEDGVESSAVLPLNRFFTQYLADTRGPSSKISAKELYGMFCKFCEDEDIPSISSKAFGSEMNRLPGVERYRTGSGRGYDLNHEVLRGFLNEPEPYNPDVATGGASRLGELALEMFE